MNTKDPFGSHNIVLSYFTEMTDKPILELGSGYFSTKLIHDIIKGKNIKQTTVDLNKEWLDRFTEMEYDYHNFLLYDNQSIDKFYEKDNENWGIVFIDIGTWDARTRAIYRYKDSADYIILHDCDYFPHNNIFGKEHEPINYTKGLAGIRSYDDIFKYWIETFLEDDTLKKLPPTLVGSNKFSLLSIKIEGVTVLNKSSL